MEKIFLQKLIESQSNGLIILNKDLVVLYANKKVKEFFSSDVSQLLGNYLRCNNTIVEKKCCRQTSKCGECIINKAIKLLEQTYESQNIESIKFNSDGKYINLSLKISEINDYIVIEFIDLCDLYEEINLLSRIIDKSKDIVFIKDSNLKYKYVNKSFLELFNCELNEIINYDDKDLLIKNIIDNFLYIKLKKVDIKTNENSNFSQVIFYKNKYLSISEEVIDGGILGIGRDITDEVNANMRAETDFLSGLFNRRKFISDIYNILKGEGEGYYLAIIDIDDLKSLNNIYGHLKGDEYISHLGRVLKSFDQGKFYRTGGDEFVVLINLNREEVNSLFNEIFNKLENLNCDPPLTISAGISKIDINKSYEENYRKVDNLLYEAKAKGKNRFILN